MATTKLDMLAQRFMQQIQDPIVHDPITQNLLPGNIIRTILEIQNYCGNACLKYVKNIWGMAKGDRNLFISFIPELFKTQTIQFPNNTAEIDMTQAVLFKDFFDCLDSYNGTIPIEIWNPVHLTDALTNNDPFYAGSALRPGLIYQKPYLYLFPASLSGATGYPVSLNYIALPIDPSTGDFLVIDGNTDIPFSYDHIQEIADIAVQLYRTDDAEAQSAG
jgi:hypothetical protein